MSEDRTKTLAQEATESRTGQVIAGKFRILREIGRGGMGVVYEAEDTSLMRTVALKFLPAGIAASAEANERFVQEARAASALDHPHICNIHEIGRTEAGEMFIAMSSYRGQSLKDRLATGPLEPSEVVGLATQIAEGLAEAHAHGIIHRDVKPGNIFVTSDGTAKILDFGLAKLAGQLRMTQPGTTMGTVAYMSPEQARGEETDARTDVWSLGVVLYEMVTGDLPFKGEKDQAVLRAVLSDPPRPVARLRPGFPSGIEALIGRALSKDPAGRFATAGEFAEELRRLRDKLAAGAGSSARRLVFRRPRRRAMVISAAALVTVAAVAIVTWLANKPSLAFESRDKVLVADVENLTGDKVFDVALRTAIEAGLQQSPYASIFDKPQVAETLRLMRMDAGSRIDEQLGCEVCRFAGVRALLVPSIISAGEAFDLQVVLVDPVRRRHVDRIRVTARGKEDVLLRAIDELTERVQSRLGESLGSIEKASRPVADISTSSWDALNYFSMGMNRWQEGKYKDAAALIELALEKDSQFVDARGSLGLLYIQFLGKQPEGKELLRQALRDAEAQNLPQRDLLKLRATNKQFVDGDLPGALEQYGVLQELYPDFWPAWNNAGMILRALGRYDEAVAMYEKAAEVAPRNSIPLLNLWFTQMNFRKDPKAGESVGRRIVDLSPDMAYSHNILGFSLAAQERFEEAEKEFRRVIEIEPNHVYGLPNLAHVLLAAGRAAEAVPVYREVLALGRQGRMSGAVFMQAFDLALALRESGQLEEARKVAAEAREALEQSLEGETTGAQDLATFGMIEVVLGRTPEAEAYLRKAVALGLNDYYTLLDAAKLCSLLGRKDEALGLLKKALDMGSPDYFFLVISTGFESIRKEPEFRALFKLGD